MKNAITTATLAFALIISGAALAETAKPVKPASNKIDLMTTQSVEVTPNCSGFSAKIKNTACAKTPATSYPQNALSGMNLGF